MVITGPDLSRDVECYCPAWTYKAAHLKGCLCFSAQGGPGMPCSWLLSSEGVGSRGHVASPCGGALHMDGHTSTCVRLTGQVSWLISLCGGMNSME